MSESHKGNKRSNETKKKISEARLKRKERLGYLNSSETRQIMSRLKKRKTLWQGGYSPY